MNRKQKLSLLSALAIALAIFGAVKLTKNRGTSKSEPTPSQNHWIKTHTESDLFRLAQEAITNRKYSEAEIYLRSLLAKDPRHTVALELLADTMTELGNTQEAIRILRTRVQLAPSSPESQQKLDKLLDTAR